MSQKLMSVTVRGNHLSWSFSFYGDPAHIKGWRADGLEVFEIENTIPVGVAGLGLTRAWCFVQDLIHFKNPFRK